MADLSPTMQRAVDYAAKHGGVLARFPGGFWRESTWSQWSTAQAYHHHFGTPTIEALVKRGAAEYTEWQEGRNGRFPVKVALRSSTVPAGAPGAGNRSDGGTR